MKWLYVTAGLLTICFCLVTWIYLRDRDMNWQQPSIQEAQADAADVLNGAKCHVDCAADVLGHIGPHRWMIRITVRGRSRCLQINLHTFGLHLQHGLSGIHPSRCP
jgi:hypothetical protein